MGFVGGELPLLTCASRFRGPHKEASLLGFRFEGRREATVSCSTGSTGQQLGFAIPGRLGSRFYLLDRPQTGAFVMCRFIKVSDFYEPAPSAGMILPCPYCCRLPMLLRVGMPFPSRSACSSSILRRSTGRCPNRPESAEQNNVWPYAYILVTAPPHVDLCGKISSP